MITTYTNWLFSTPLLTFDTRKPGAKPVDRHMHFGEPVDGDDTSDPYVCIERLDEWWDVGAVDHSSRMRFAVSRRENAGSYSAKLVNSNLIELIDSRGYAHYVPIAAQLWSNFVGRLREIRKGHSERFHLAVEFSTADEVGA